MQGSKKHFSQCLPIRLCAAPSPAPERFKSVTTTGEEAAESPRMDTGVKPGVALGENTAYALSDTIVGKPPFGM